VMTVVLAMVPRMDDASELRKAADSLARKIRRQVARARAEGAADVLGGARGGHA
jgi:hypothetical protein